jgi:integrase
LSIRSAIVKAEEEGTATLSATTQADYLRTFKAMLKFAVRRKHLAFDPAADAKPLKKAKSLEERRMPFTSVQLRSFFTGTFYKSCVPSAADEYHRQDRDWRFWIPLLMLFSGARPNEIAQLCAGDIRRSDSGNPYLNLFPDGIIDPMKLKTRSSRRRIPIHCELIKLGFLKFVEGRRKDAGDKARLFPTLKPNRLGNYAHYASRRFNEVFLTSEIEVAADQSLYSLRHNVRDALRRVDAPPEALRAIGGWSVGGKSASDYYGDATNPDHYVKWVNAISYPTLDLSFLHV